MRKGLMCLLAALLLSLCGTAFAHEAPDLTRTGTLRIAMRFDGVPVAGGSLTLYRVGEIREDDGNYSFAPTGDFAESGLSLTDIESVALAAELAGYAKSKNIPGETKPVGSDGAVKYDLPQLGLYLLVQNEAAAGYNAAAPFLVTVPMLENERYVYEVDASPKVELEKAPPTPTPAPDTPDEKLPQTGQTNWPVPVLAAAGVILFTLGWIIRFRREREDYAK